MFISLSADWPWYLAGPVIGLFVPALLIVGNKLFGVSSNLRHLCSAIVPGNIEYFRYDWKRTGLWNLLFVAAFWLAVSLLRTGVDRRMSQFQNRPESPW